MNCISNLTILHEKVMVWVMILQNRKTPTKFIDYQRFVEVIFTFVGKTGFEPATPRPPA